ncbi:Zn-dependent protease with chaperone function [Desulfofundulus luciae]|uniref:Zn-dependent protease with chaperone function n=1 Tax=Desulfofundulus luciae TaxID=74702 RepID=A0ABU0AZ08_9FIRM|nr:M48 family metallopeptidase [Desulfofundulus luciae]MDQ0285704.1 Zn-dependent protease with chaperone function [Desulfofundulus luciae]
MLNLSALRHEKEALYLTIGSIVGGVVWLGLVIWWLIGVILSFGVMLFGTIFYLIILTFVYWLTGQYFKAQVFGNAVRVSKEQFPKVAEIVEEIARELNLTEVPDVFVLSGQGALNALAIRFLSGRYVLLYGELVDLILRRSAYEELKMIIGHELAHHALGHVSIWKNFLLFPSRLIPFLGAAYSRACELSADRVGMILAGNSKAAGRALLALTLGSEALAAAVDPEAFTAQEKFVPPVMGFIYELYATHPRMTRRIIELKEYERRLALTPGLVSGPVYPTLAGAPGKAASQTFTPPVEPLKEIAAGKEESFCPDCGHEFSPGDLFCQNCGRKRS